MVNNEVTTMTTDEALLAIAAMIDILADCGAGGDELWDARRKLNQAGKTLAVEIKRLQAENAAIDEVLGAAVEEYGREAAEVVLTRTEDGSVQIETRCKPEADEFATGETVSNAASNMVGRWCE